MVLAAALARAAACCLSTEDNPNSDATASIWILAFSGPGLKGTNPGFAGTAGMDTQG